MASFLPLTSILGSSVASSEKTTEHITTVFSLVSIPKAVHAVAKRSSKVCRSSVVLDTVVRAWSRCTLNKPPSKWVCRYTPNVFSWKAWYSRISRCWRGRRPWCSRSVRLGVLWKLVLALDIASPLRSKSATQRHTNETAAPTKKP